MAGRDVFAEGVLDGRTVKVSKGPPSPHPWQGSPHPLIMYIQHLLDISIMKINPVGYTFTLDCTHSDRFRWTGPMECLIFAHFSHPIFCLHVFVVHPGTTFFP
jgi:hypothetical protein